MYPTPEIERLVRKAHLMRAQAIANALTAAWNATLRLAARLTGRSQRGGLAHR